MLVDCDTCPVRQVRCGECMISALAFDAIPVRQDAPSSEVPLDALEHRAVAMLVQAGLVSRHAASAARAVLDEPWAHSHADMWAARGEGRQRRLG